jgi:ABC-2 type transport system permease protein
MVWVGVTQLVPGPDPHRNRANPLEGGESTAAQGLLVFFAGILPAVPAAAMVRAGMVQDNDLLLWGGVPVGIATGVLGAWLLGRIAYSHLEARGPELLYLMRTGRSSQATTGEAPQPSVLETMTLRQQFVLFLGVWLGSIALFPQGLVPLGIKLSGGGDPVWFLPLYLPQALQWPAIAVMVLLGLGTYGLVARIYLRRKSELWRLQRER